MRGLQLRLSLLLLQLLHPMLVTQLLQLLLTGSHLNLSQKL